MCIAVEPVLKDHPIGHKKHGLSRQVGFADRLIYIEIWNLRPRTSGPSRQTVASYGSGLSRQTCLLFIHCIYNTSMHLNARQT